MRYVTFILVSLLSVGTAHADLVAFYPFDDAGNPQQDQSGNNTSLVTNGSAGAPTYAPAGGFEGGAFQFSGTQHFELGVNFNAITGFTVGGWVLANAGLPSGLYKWFGTDNGSFDPTMGLDNRFDDFRYTAFTGTTAPNILTGTPDYTSPPTWVFMAMTFTGNASGSGTLTLYVDTDASTQGDALQAFANAASFDGAQATAAIGNLRPDASAEGWQGAIDNVFVYNEVLSSTQLTAIRDGGASAIPEPSTWMLLLAGFALLLAFSAKRRRFQ